MLTRIESFFRKWRRRFSRTEWAIRLLGLPRRAEPSDAFGLVMVQIDGLSMRQFNRAMEKGRMPFLRSLSRRESYSLHSHYSGIPSNTPAVQAEIFYGVQTAVPAFHYVDHATGRVIKMYDNESARLVESRLRAHDKGLLAGGSSYCNIFSGGADEAHFCADNNGWKGLLRAANPLVLPFLVLCYADIFIRTAFLIAVEFFLALYDCVRGTMSGKVFLHEFQFIFTRVAACVLLRELIVVGVCMDLARGLPIIHANFIGYDEQSHRRGPSSTFAHWSLGGIDDSIRRIWKAAGLSDRQDYDVWVYSDHGQEKTVSYPEKFGMPLDQAVKKIFGETAGTSKEIPSGAGIWRSYLLDDRLSKKWIGLAGKEAPPEPVIVTAMGPVGHIYIRNKLDAKDLAEKAQQLVAEAGIPLVLAREGKDQVRVWMRKGNFLLSEHAEKVFGAGHPFLAEAQLDLARVCAHDDAGDLVIMGWVDGEAPMSFPMENGAHAGIGPEETSGFAFLPRDTPLDVPRKPYLRPIDLHTAARRFMGEDLFRYYSPARVAPATTLTVMTYNVHGCVGMDGKLSVDRIARIIARHNPDIVALQELDVGRLRSKSIDQAERIARKLEMNFHFHPTFRLKDEQYGNAIFSRYPMSIRKMAALPAYKKSSEPRAALWVTVDAEGTQFQLINTHLSIWPAERLLQARALAGPEWLAHPDCAGPVVLCGDFNASPRTPAYRRMCEALKDCQRSLPKHRPTRTWSGKYGISRIDHVFLSPEWEVLRVEVPRSHLDRAASDHVPLLVRLKIHAVL